METEKLDRLTRIRARIADWFNPPNGVNVKLSAKGRGGTIRHVVAMFDNAADDLQYCLEEIRRLEGVRTRLEGKQSQVRQALYDHAGEIKVGERECRDALEIRALRAQRDLLMVAVRNECAKFTFPDEDRPDLHAALKEAEDLRWNRGFDIPNIPTSEEEAAEQEALALDQLRIDLAIKQADSEHPPTPGSIAHARGDK